MTEDGAGGVGVVYATGTDADGVATRLEREREAFEVRRATSAQAVVDAVSDGVECVVTADGVADADAIDLLERVRDADEAVPVVLVPERDDASLAGAAVSAGATDYVQRDGDGVPVERLADSVASAVGDYREDRRRRRERAFLEEVEATVAGRAVVVDPEGRVVWADEEPAGRLGLDEDARHVADAPLFDADGEPVPDAERPYAAVVRTGERVEAARYRVGEGDDRRAVSITADPIEVGGDLAYVAVRPEDVTERGGYRGGLESGDEALAAELREVFDRVSDAVIALDDEWRFTYVNDRAEQLIEVDRSEVVGESIWEIFEDAVGTTFHEKYREAMATQQSVSFEEFYAPLDAWFEVRAYPSETGLSVYFRDVTERKVRERQLEESRSRLRTFVEHIPNGTAALVDEDLRYQVVGGELWDPVDAEPADLEGQRIREAVPRDLAEVLAPRVEAALAGERSQFTVEYGGEVREAYCVPVRDDEGEVLAAMAISHDVTAQREHEGRLRALHSTSRELFRAESHEGVDRAVVREMRRALDLSGAAVFELDEERDVLEAVAVADPGLLERGLPDYPADETNVVGHAFRAGRTQAYDDVRTAENLAYEDTPLRSLLLVPFGETRVLAVASDEVGVYGDRTRQLVEIVAANAAVAHDRVARELELEARASQQAAVTELGRDALADAPLDRLFAEAAELVADRLDTPYSKVLDYRPERDDLLLRAGVGWDDGLVGEHAVPGKRDSQAGFVLESDAPVVVEDMAAEERFSPEPLLTDHGATSGVSVVVGSPDDPWGVLGAHATDHRTFSEDDVNFVQGVANVLASTIDNRTKREELAETAEVFREVYALAADDGLSFDERLDRLLDLGRDYLGLDAGFMTRIDSDTQTVTAARGDVVSRGETCPMEAAYCAETHSAGALRSVRDATTADWVDEAAYDRWGFDAYVGAPLTVQDRPYGTFCFAGTTPRAAPFTDAEKTFVELVSQWVEFELERQQRQVDLEETERQFQAAFDNPHSFMAILDPDGRIRQVNEEALSFGDVAAGDVVGERFWETPWFAHDGAVQDQVREATAAAASGESLRDEIEHAGADGDRKVIDTVMEPVRDASGEVVSVFASGRDVTDRKERDEALQRAYEIFVDPGMSFEAKVDALLELGCDTLETDYGTLSRVEGEEYVFEAVATPPDADLTAGDTTSLSATNCERVVETQSDLVLADVAADAPDLAGRAGNAEWGISSYLGTPVTVGDDVYGTFCFYDKEARAEEFADWKVTFADLLSNWVEHELERRQRQVHLEETERQFQAAFDNPSSFMAILDPDGSVRRVNEVALEFIDAVEADVVGERFWETPWWNHSPALQRRLQSWLERVRDGEYVRFEEDHVGPGGERVTVDGVFQPVTDDDGEVVAIFVSGRDITERKQREAELEHQRERLTALNDLNSLAQRVGGAVVRQSSREEIEQLVCDTLTESDAYEFAWVGQATDGMLTSSTEAGVDGYLDEIDVRLDDAESPAATAYRTDEMQVVEDARSDPRFERWHDVAESYGYRSVGCVPISFEGAVYGVLSVYSERVDAFGEEERETFERLGTIVAHAMQSVDRERQLRESERRYRTLAENIPNGSVTMVGPDMCYRLAAGENFASLDVDPADLRGQHIRDVDVFSPAVRDELAGLFERALDGEHVSTELEYEGRTFAYHVIPVEADGDVLGAMSLSQDVTERVARERELEHERERLELLNRLIRHNLLNSLNVVDARLTMVEGSVDPEVGDHLDTATDRTAEMIDLIETIRALMAAIDEEEEQELEPVALPGMLRDELADAAAAYPDAEFETGDLPDVAVAADDLLSEVIENLLVNAVQHNDADLPRIRVDVDAGTDDVVVTVADNGPGVPEDLRETIFEKGTKGFESPGTGFGLHLVREIVDAYGGDVTVADNDPRGAVFRLRLPRA